MKRLAALLVLLTPIGAMGHDTWVQTNARLIRVNDVVHVDLMLGNHGNEHRDFKVAGKASLESATLEVIDPDGQRFDLKSQAIDTGYGPQEGYWTARFEPDKPGLHMVAHRAESVVSYAPERSIKSSKTFFVVSPSLDRVSTENPGFDRPMRHELELIPVLNPITPMGPGSSIKVRLLYQGKPLVGERVSFIPRGAKLKPGLDDQFERITDNLGEASFDPTEANYYLIAAHKTEPRQGGTLDGKPYESTKYGATMTVFVPRTCPCCGE